MSRTLTLLMVVLAVIPAAAESRRADHIVLVSVDGFRPEFYLEDRWPAQAFAPPECGGSSRP